MTSSATDFSVPDKVREQMLDDDDPELLRHVKRPQWGLAILAWERGDRRAYQFEDGRQRTFKAGYYDLMKPAQSQQRSEEAVIADLQAAIGTTRSTTRKALEPSATFDEQVALFKELYPKGFQSEKWVEEHRGTEGRSLKRHRDPAIRKAQEVLSQAEVAAMMAEARYADLRDAVTTILSSTSLVSLRHVKTFRGMDEEETEQFAVAVAELLHGEGDFSPRFKAWVEVLDKVLGGKPSWRIATVLPALLDPEKHVCVRHSAFIRQAASIAPTSRYSRRPRARSYRNFRRVARVAHTRLEAAGLKPRDLMDVHDFIWTTLRDSALDHISDDE
ncbi:hypothetical protein [Gaopeijia maritima]|uniref:Uncharacterized protein n=1 Tax=Gaopeijia maritima TaxID=3119007 RepID=A0ABU9EAU7_9BACT